MGTTSLSVNNKIVNVNNKKWCWIFCYIFFLYFTLPINGFIVKWLYNNVGKKLLSMTVSLIGLSFLVVIFILFRKLSKAKTLMALAMSFSIFLWANLHINLPAERIHFIEYAILGMMVYKSREKIPLTPTIGTIIFVFIVGVTDELIQAILPNRVGDPRDVLMNAVGGLWGIWLVWLYEL